MIRYRYETGIESHREIARALKISYSTLAKRAMREGWTQRKQLVKAAAAKLEAEVDHRIQQEIRDELAPWIEQRKREIIKRGFKVAAKGLDRVEALMSDDQELDAKRESFTSQAADRYVRLGRLSLGMSDGSAVSGPINLNILANQAAVQVQQPQQP